jgi:hypothetical protein
MRDHDAKAWSNPDAPKPFGMELNTPDDLLPYLGLLHSMVISNDGPSRNRSSTR